MKFRVKDDYDPYKVVADIMESIVDKIYGIEQPGDLIIHMGIKYDHEDEYTYTNELLYYTEYGNYSMWESDWCEGQRNIDILGFIPVDEVVTCYNFYNKDVVDNRKIFDRKTDIKGIMKGYGSVIEYE